MESFENNQTNSKESKNSNAGRGGARKNAGRKTGSATTRTREIADKAMEDGISPLEYMLNVMRSKAPETEDARIHLAHTQMCFEAAKAAAPYVHPRLNAIEHSGGVTIRTLAEELTGLNALADAAGSTPVA